MREETPVHSFEDVLTEKEVNEAAEKTLPEVLEAAFLDFIQMAVDNGMTEADVDRVIRKVTNDRANFKRSAFKVLR